MSSIHNSQILTITNSFVQALLFGIYITTLIHGLRWLVYNDGGQDRWGRGNVPMLIISIVIFFLQTMVLAALFKSTLLALNLDAMGYRTFNTIGVAMEFTIYQVVDAVLIYRCWIVYGRTGGIICVPIFLWISTVVFSSYNVYLYASSTVLDVGKHRVSSLTGKLCDGFFACNIVINIYATGSVSRSKCLHRTWHIIAEAGVTYTTSTLINLIAITLTDRNPNYMPYELLEATAHPIVRLLMIVYTCCTSSVEPFPECHHGWHCVQPHFDSRWATTPGRNSRSRHLGDTIPQCRSNGLDIGTESLYSSF
ncbi:hypothetical protein AX15_005538 [Amanita polypyramis BW_CC]|nr:hypothetical protein AX15_005538 [Amanita polypyramis BW_CC]